MLNLGLRLEAEPALSFEALDRQVGRGHDDLRLYMNVLGLFGLIWIGLDLFRWMVLGLGWVSCVNKNGLGSSKFF